ncbi:MAG: hypothetical protein R6U19_09590 [Bacteroidales bacterium]
MHRKNKNIIFVAIFMVSCLAGLSLKSQTRISSPYSRYGIGSLSQSANARILGMGGVSQASASSLYINYNNPATYSAFRKRSFVFNGGIRSRQSELKTSTETAQSNYTSLGYLQFGSPVTEWMGISFGLMPFSNIGYNIKDEQTYDDIGHVLYQYEGSGGINQFYIGSGVSLTPELSLGVNAVYYFGKMDLRRSSMFPDSVNYLDTRIIDRQSPGDIRLNYGLYYEKNLNDDYALALGATFSNRSPINTKRDYLVQSIKASSSDYISVIDTITIDQGSEGNIVLPGSLGGGFSIHKKGSWELSGDFSWENWEKYEAFGEKDSLENAFTAALGYSFSPSSTSVSAYWKKIHYRLGGNYQQSYLHLRQTQLNKIGISFGLGLPIPRSASSFDLGVEVGQMGTTDNNLIKETYVEVSLGLSIFERWFVQPKYD